MVGEIYSDSYEGGASRMEVQAREVFVPNTNVTSSSLRSLLRLTCCCCCCCCFLPPPPPPPPFPALPTLLLRMLLNLFLTAFSLLPGRIFAISLHLFPRSSCCSTRTASSAEDQSALLTEVSRWFNQRSRHCFPARPGKWEAEKDHFLEPNIATSLRSRLQGGRGAKWRG